MADFDTDAFFTDAFFVDAFDLTGAGIFPGDVVTDGGRMWPARSGDPRWTQFLTDSGITQTGNFQDDIKVALEAFTGKTKMDINTMWKIIRETNGITDLSEPFTY